MPDTRGYPKKGRQARRKLGVSAPAKYEGEQPGLSVKERNLVSEIYARYRVFSEGCAEAHAWAREARQIALLNDPRQDLPGTPPEQKALQMHTLKSTINNMIADQMDNMPEAYLRPERPELQQVAEDLTDVVRFILEQNDYEDIHRERTEDFFVPGTSVLQVVWDEKMDGGTGNVSLLRWPVEGLLWDPMAETIQDARALMKISWHPLSWYRDQFPDEARYIHGEPFGSRDAGVPDAWTKKSTGEEDMARLIEYWYRLYDADSRTYRVHVAYAAGGALLYSSEKAHPDRGVYLHGQYPFIVDVHTKVPGMPVGIGAVTELRSMQRYINRYYHYFDVNTRQSAKGRLLVNRNSQIDMLALRDWNTDIIQGQAIDDGSVHWLTTPQLTGAATGIAIQLQTDMKQDSGQNQFTRGETAGGVTAASAIASLQESGSKVTRLRTQTLQQGFKRMVEQVLWLVAEYYTRDKARMITGTDRTQRMIQVDAERMYNGDPQPEGMLSPAGTLTNPMSRAPAAPKKRINVSGPSAEHGTLSLPPPPYNVQIQIQRRNPLRVQAFNEIVMQAYQIMLQNGQPFPASTLFRLLEIEGKDRLLPAIDATEQLAQQMQQMGQALEQATQQNTQLMQANAQLQETLRGQAAEMAGSRGTTPESMAISALDTAI